MTTTTSDYATLSAVGLWESCRECRDEQPFGVPGVLADFILWGKLFAAEALGPRCYDHAAKHLGHLAMGMIDQYAVFDLRPARQAVMAERVENARLRSSLAFFAGRFLAVAPRHEGSGGDRPDRCAVCGDDADSHNAAEFGGGCGVCGDCPGFEPSP